MICRLDDLIWFGDKGSVKESRGTVGSVINVASNIRRPYWSNVGKLDWWVWYFRLGWPDREPVIPEYIQALSKVVESIQNAEQFPLLCHCRMGGHRGPTAAVFAYWFINGKTPKALSDAISKVESYRPGYNRPSSLRVFKSSLLEYCEGYVIT